MTQSRDGMHTPKLPPYPEHFAASSIGAQVERSASSWRAASRSLLEEVDAAERALADRLAAQDARNAAKERIRNFAKGQPR